MRRCARPRRNARGIGGAQSHATVSRSTSDAEVPQDHLIQKILFEPGAWPPAPTRPTPPLPSAPPLQTAAFFARLRPLPPVHRSTSSSLAAHCFPPVSLICLLCLTSRLPDCLISLLPVPTAFLLLSAHTHLQLHIRELHAPRVLK